MKKIWILPMAGKGTRTKEFGEFKPFISICEKKIIHWFLKSIKKNVDNEDIFVFITTEYFINKYDFFNEIKSILEYEGIENEYFIKSVKLTPIGPAATVYEAREYLYDDCPVIIINCDQYIDFEIPTIFNSKTGYLPVNVDFGEKKSYVQITDNKITKIVEKDNISNIASSGVYILSKGKDLLFALDKQFEDKITCNGEYYVGPALNYLIKESYDLYPIAVKAKFDLGNVVGINIFKNIISNFI